MFLLGTISISYHQLVSVTIRYSQLLNDLPRQDMMFWSVEKQELLGGFEDTRDVDWETYTACVGWSVQVTYL